LINYVLRQTSGRDILVQEIRLSEDHEDSISAYYSLVPAPCSPPHFAYNLEMEKAAVNIEASTAKVNKSEKTFSVQNRLNHLLDELVEDLSSFLGSSDVRTALNEATRKRVEETYLCWEKVYLNGDGEQVALEITKTRQRFLTILHDFMVAIFSGT